MQDFCWPPNLAETTMQGLHRRCKVCIADARFGDSRPPKCWMWCPAPLHPPATMGRSLMGLVGGPTTKTWDISCSSSSSFWPAVLFKLLARTLPRIKLTSLVDKARPPEENTKGRLRKGAHHSQAVHAKQKRCAENVHLQTR